MVRRCALGDGGHLGAVERTGWAVGVVGDGGVDGVLELEPGVREIYGSGGLGEKETLPPGLLLFVGSLGGHRFYVGKPRFIRRMFCGD